MRKGFLFVWLSLGVFFSFTVVPSAYSSGAIPKQKTKPKIEVIKGEYIVKLKQDAFGPTLFTTQTASLKKSLSKRFALKVHALRNDPSFLKVKMDKGNLSPASVMDEIKANPEVEYVEPNYIYHAFGATPVWSEFPVSMPDDPDLKYNWGLINEGQKIEKGRWPQPGIPGADIGASMAWMKTTGSKDIVVAIIDTGVDYTHPELKHNIYVNKKEIPGNGIDDDGNGFIDDVHGWNFEGKSNDPMDDNDHGTHCAGTIGAEGNNGIGTAGVNWHVSIMPLKFLSAEGSGSLEDALEAIKYATLMHVNVMSNSWGGGGYSQALFDAIKDARDHGILFVAAAGNNGTDNDKEPMYPAGYQLDNVISVAATDNRDSKAPWSCYGHKTVHLAAPGVDIYSTAPHGGYQLMSGTSMACPHVSGAAALLWSVDKKMTYADIKSRLLATVDPVRALGNKTITGGRLNIDNALNNLVPARRSPPDSAWKSMVTHVESKHPYDNSTTQLYEIKSPGAKFMRVRFSKIDVEAGYDVIQITDKKGNVVDDASGVYENYVTQYVDGDTLIIKLVSDSSQNGFGFVVDQYEFID